MEQFIELTLYTDEENQKDEKGEPLGYKFQDYEEKLYGTIGQPLYGVLTPDGKPVLGANGKPLMADYVKAKNPENFVKFLREARERAGL
jgi:hypothetical protein